MAGLGLARKASVNLLPEALRPVRRVPWRKVVGVLLAVAAAGALATAAWLLVAERRAAEAELAALRREEARLRADVAVRQELAGARAELERKSAFVERTRERRAAWRTLSWLVEATPAGMVLTGVTLDEQGAVVEGTSPSLVAVARLLRAIEASGFFRAAEAVFPQPFRVTEEGTTIPFRISARADTGGERGEAAPAR